MNACTCGHPKALHNSACRINGCPCEDYRDPDTPLIPPGDEPRRLTIEVPPGFYVQIALIPVEAGSGPAE